MTSLMESVPLPILAIGKDRYVVAINQALEKLFGAHVLGRHYIAALRQPLLLREIESVFEGGGQITARFLHQDGLADVTFDVQVSSIEDGVILVFQDRSATDTAIQSRRAFVATLQSS